MSGAPPDVSTSPRSERRLSEVARHLVIPEGIVATLWFDIEDRIADFGDRLDPWQSGLGTVSFGLREDDLFAATVGGCTYSIPRQVAKTFMVGRSMIALCTLYENVTVLWTAHRTRTATRTFESLVGVVSRPAVAPYVKSIRRANGEQEIRFTSGSVILFGAREQGFGRGFEEVDFEVFDEAQILTEAALEDMVPATNQSRFPHGPLLFFMGTPPRPKDPGEEFTARRKEALEAKAAHPGETVVKAGDSLYVEMSADDTVGEPGGPSLTDKAQILAANPSVPHRTPWPSIWRMRKQLTNDDSWKREALGVWDRHGVKSWQVIPRDAWGKRAIAATAAPKDGDLTWAVKFSADGAHVALGVAVKPKNDGPVHVECVGVAKVADGVSQLADALSKEHIWRRSLVVVDGKAGAGDLVNLLHARGVRKRQVQLVQTPDAITAHSSFLRAVVEGSVTHLDQPGLTAAARAAGRRKIGNAGGWGWESLVPDVTVVSLDAVTLAYGAATDAARRPAGSGEFVF